MDNDGQRVSSKYYLTGIRNGVPIDLTGYRSRIGKTYRDNGGKIFTWVTPYFSKNQYNYFTYTNYDQRLIWFDETGLVTDSVKYNLDVRNYIMGGAQKDDGSLLLASNVIYNFDYFTNRLLSRVYSVNESGTISNLKVPETIVKSSFGSVCKMNDGSFAILGYMQRAGESMNKFVIIKTNKNGEI